jgi:hypothetical protein
MSPTDKQPQLELATNFTFEASHRLPHAPEHSKCRRLHGHSWKVEVRVRGPLQAESGWVIDFDDIKRACDARPPPPQRHRGARQPHQRDHRAVDLGAAGAAHTRPGGDRGARDLHGALHLSRSRPRRLKPPRATRSS